MSAPTDAEKIAAKLTEAQRKALVHPNAGGTSYQWIGLGTCEALCARGLVRRIPGVGSFWSPQTAIEWPLTPLGLEVREEVRKILEREA